MYILWKKIYCSLHIKIFDRETFLKRSPSLPANQTVFQDNKMINKKYHTQCRNISMCTIL